jgi:SWI/SNF-related matrix-associated actin-dependent regulator 1 of chromatin subfamily A
MPLDLSPPPTLRFRKNRFILENVSTEKLRHRLRTDAYWQILKDDSFATDNLGSAVTFRKYADDHVERIFKRRLQEHYHFDRALPLELDPHQRKGVRWVLSRKRSYLAHAPGAGKTAQAVIAACLASGDGQTLFIVPPSLTLNWNREILKCTEWLKRPDYFPTVGIIDKTENQNSVAWKADFVICPDSMLAKDWVHPRLRSIPWKFIGVDEGSRFKAWDAERSLALYGGTVGDRHFPGIFLDARHVVFLDGSPMPNRPMELWAPTYALHPEAIDCLDQNDFGYRYCGAKPNEYGQWEFLHSSNEVELKEKLQKDFMHVVTEAELSHPERLRSMVIMNEDVRTREHRTWERKHLSSITDIDENASQGDLARFRRELGIRKVPWVARYVRERLEDKNESILLFAWHREVCEQLAIQIAKSYRTTPGIIYGGINPVLREKFFQDFQSGKDKVLILNITAGGRGHNLQKADRAIFAEFSWTDETNRQCEKRGSRRGSDKAFLRCDYIVCPNSLDERVASSCFTKEKRVKRVIG